MGQASSESERRWAAFIAAAVDQLAWESEPRIVTSDRVRDADTSSLILSCRRAGACTLELVDTPAAFTRRNIYGGDRIISRV